MTAGRKAFEAHAEAAGNGLEWEMLNAQEQGRWVAVENAFISAPRVPSTPRPPFSNEAIECQWAILKACHDILPAWLQFEVFEEFTTDVELGKVQIVLRHQ